MLRGRWKAGGRAARALGACLVLAAAPAALPLQEAPPDAGRWGRTEGAGTEAAAMSPVVTAAQLVGAAVRSSDAREVGSVVDLDIDGRDGTVLFAAIAPTGSLGAGGRLTAVPVDILARTADGSLSLIGVSRARFANGVKFSASAWPDAGDRVAYAAWVGSVWQVFDRRPTWNAGGDEVPVPTSGRAPPEEGDGEDGAVDSAARAAAAAEEAERLQRAASAAALLDRPEGVRASTLGRADLFDSLNQRCGRVRGLCIDLRTGRVEYVAVALRAEGGGGELLDDSVLRILPWRAVSCQYGGDRLYATLSAAQLADAPGAPADAWPDLASPEWKQRLDAFYPPPAAPVDAAPAGTPDAPPVEAPEGAPEGAPGGARADAPTDAPADAPRGG